MYNLKPIKKMMRCSLPISNIDRIDLCVATIKVQLCPLIFYLVHLMALKNVFCMEQLAVNQQIILSRSVIT